MESIIIFIFAIVVLLLVLMVLIYRGPHSDTEKDRQNAQAHFRGGYEEGYREGLYLRSSSQREENQHDRD